MSEEEKEQDASTILKSLVFRLEAIEKSMSSLESRMLSLEKKAERSFKLRPENPLIFSKTLVETLDTIREFELRNNHGVTARQLGKIRKVVLPTIYEHLSKLEETGHIFWQRGTELGLDPPNSKFYSLVKRDKLLSDLPVLMSLPQEIMPLAQQILKNAKRGMTKESLIAFAWKLASDERSPWSSITESQIPVKVDDAIRYLMQMVLVERVRTQDGDYYYPWKELDRA